MTETTDKIKKYKAKFHPDIIFLRWKQTGDLAVFKYWREAIRQYALDALREAYADAHNLGIVEQGRLFQFSRELEQLRSGYDYLWAAAGLPEELFETFKTLQETGRQTGLVFPQRVRTEISPFVYFPPTIKIELVV